MKITELGFQTFPIIEGTFQTVIAKSYKRDNPWVAVCTGKNVAQIERSYLDRVSIVRSGEGSLVTFSVEGIEANSVLETKNSYHSPSRYWRVSSVDSSELIAMEYATLSLALKAATLVATGVVNLDKAQIAALKARNIRRSLPVEAGRFEIPFPHVFAAYMVNDTGSYKPARSQLRIDRGTISMRHLKENDVLEFHYALEQHFACRVLHVERSEIVLLDHDSTKDAIRAARSAKADAPQRSPYTGAVPAWHNWDFEDAPLWLELRTEDWARGWNGPGADQ